MGRALQALLALAVATSWFTESQVENLDEWLDEVASCTEEDWISKFGEADLGEVVLKNLKAQEITEITIDKIGKAIVVEYKGGNYGQGRHDGNVHLSDEGLKLYDSKNERYLVYGDELPNSVEELGRCLQDPNWDYDESEW